jgi:hypothetical protein
MMREPCTASAAGQFGNSIRISKIEIAGGLLVAACKAAAQVPEIREPSQRLPEA